MSANGRANADAAQKAAQEAATTPEAVAAALAPIVREKAGERRLLAAVAGPPGAGKSTLSEQLVDRLNADTPRSAALLGQDGFHFDDRVLEARGDRDRKGAPHTFDVAGLRALLTRLMARNEPSVAIPVFDRRLEIARAGAALVPQEADVVVVEGNYLLLDAAPWDALRPLFGLTISLEVGPATLKARLMRRWLDQGFDAEAAAAKVDANDLPNARLVETRSVSADLAVVDGVVLRRS